MGHRRRTRCKGFEKSRQAEVCCRRGCWYEKPVSNENAVRLNELRQAIYSFLLWDLGITPLKTKRFVSAILYDFNERARVNLVSTVLVEDTSTFSTNISAQGYEGLLGLGPNSGSRVYDKIDDHSADAVMDRIFQQSNNERNFITLLLDRRGDSDDPFVGQFTISELVAGMESIMDEPKMEVVKVHKLTDENQHWQVYTDVDGVVGPDGQPIVTKSIVPKAPKGQLVAVVDSGFTFTQVPRKMADAIYGRVQGAEWDVKNNVWTIPCTQMLNITLKFGGKNFPVHPLDVSSSDFNLTNGLGRPVCVGTVSDIL